MNLKKSLWWGAMPWEPDGGAVVAYYQLQLMNYLEPTHKFHGIPKIPDYLDPFALPFMEFGSLNWFKQSPEEIYSYICQYMKKHAINLLTLWHIPPKFFPIVDEVHKIGGKVLNWQTVHWKTDTFLKSKYLNDIDFWVAPTKWAKEQMISVGGIKRDKIKYLPHAVNLEKFYPHNTTFRESLNLGKDQKVILFVGRCSLAKALHQVIPVMRPIIRDYDAIFIIKAGAFQEITKSKEIAYIINKMAKRSPNIYWIEGWKEPSFIEELMASCDILLQPSSHEGFDVPLIEAMACRKAMAVSNIANHWEILGERNRHCGVFMEPTEDTLTVNEGSQMIKVPSSQMIEGTLRFMLDNPDECEAMAETGLKRVRKKYNLAKVANDWLDLMDRFADEV